MSDERSTDAPETAGEASATGEAATERVVQHPPLPLRIAKWAGVAVGVVVALAGALLLLLNTQMGRNIVADQISGYRLASGLNVQVGRIDGSIYGAMVLHDVRVRDPKGVFATAEQITLDWRPFDFLSNHLNIRELTSPAVQVGRAPELIPGESDPDAPLLPQIDIDVARLAIGRIELAPGVIGDRHVARLEGGLHLSDGQLRLSANGGTLAAPGMAGGDRLSVRLDAEPEQNMLDLDLQVNAPAGGLIAELAGLEAPLVLSIEGDGDWDAWDGRAVGNLGGERLANLQLRARDGRFRILGITRPGLYFSGAVAELTAPQLRVAIDTAFVDRIADTRVRLLSDSLSFEAAGKLDLDANRFDGFRAEALLLRPAAIAPNLVGRSVRASVALDGSFATPTVDYKLHAGALGFGETYAEQLYAEGQAKVDAERILVPVNARAARVSGLNAAVGGLVTNLRLRGDVAINGDQILADDLRIRSDRIDATAIIAADIGDGRYTGGLKGRINDYEIDGVGVVSATTDAEIYPGSTGGFGIRGTIAGRTQRIFSDGARNFLGGNAVASVRLGYDPQGVVTFNELRVRAPKFQVRSGSGRYDPEGALLVNADAYSAQYGPLQARVTGSMANPEMLLRAPRPGLGVGLADVEARVRGENGRYAVVAEGGTDYGPFTADVLVDTGGPLSVDVRRTLFAGVEMRGQLRQTPAGPFSGRLDLAGSGINGNARLSAQGSDQQAQLSLRAADARIPGQGDMLIGRAIVDATILLADTPHIVADAQLANFARGDFVINQARAKLDYQGGSGTAKLLASGSTGVSFRLAANARLSPERWLVALQGEGNGVSFKTGNPARIVLADGGYRLQPTQIEFDQGTMRVAGSYGDGMTAQLRLDEMDLSVINAFVPGVGVGGTATGSLDFEQQTPDAFPSADARLEIANFTRSSIATVSTPVNISFVGKLLPDGGDARALIKRGSTTIGRVVATLRPLPPGSGGWQERLMAAPLSGGVRYNGPSNVLFSLAGQPGQTLSGPVGIAADFSGRVRSPQLNGVVRASNLTYENENYGTRLTNMKVDGRFSNDQLVVENITATAGEGSISAKGRVGLSADAGFPVELRAEFENAQLASSDALEGAANGWIEVTNNADAALIKGRLTIPEARYKIIRQGSAEVAQLEGVRRVRPGEEDSGYQRPERRRAGHPIRLDLVVSADNQLFVSGMGLDSEWSARITVNGTAANPRVGGYARVVEGQYSFAGRRLELSRRSAVNFEGAALTNPSLDIQASTTAENVTATIVIGGTAQQPNISFASTPSLPQDEVLSRLLFGDSVTNLSATEALQLAAALNSLRGSGGGLNPLGELRQAAGIDRLRVLGSDETTGRGTALAAGQYLTNDIYVEIITDARGFTATQLEIALTRALSILSETGSFGGSSVSLRYSKDY
ncbi:translocation/assembly module TamB domain-containing protein [Stakelama tenebrarum]|uniref:Translocation and assembly module TamB C-terminal domain-containing protein n=1 Tax=Stakelama tenebrarum TaxID=2711215 RepID=A0A6G6Y5E2_9SPHN|nr:translocation/assembly module TamB domain-containing protein [Sphingosinithalassobacter tenebrarum]QIG80152.1 hypothetical protein G5C33_10410 [Sphingosinithalassobacter tenebrarum]